MARAWKSLPPPWATIAAIVLLAVITWIDYETGYELGLFVFYFVPVALAAWYVGRRSGLMFAVASAVCWYLSDRLGGHPYSNAYLIYWETLMRLVAYATTALTLSAIRERTRQLEDLLHLVSHDLRAPLAALTGQAQLLRRRGGESTFATARAEAILRSAKRMDRMIEDLLDGARSESRTLRLALEPLDLTTWLPSLLEGMREAFEVERVELSVPDRPTMIRADPSRLERVVVNLLVNALKYSPPKGRVRLSVTARAAGGATLAVSNPGDGIADADRPHLFEPFFRGSGVSDRGGLGLGLYSAHQLVKAHGGTIRVESEPGAGATFLVDLPSNDPGRSGRAARSIQTSSDPEE